MKCEEIQNWILLELSGELPQAKKVELDEHCISCPACSQYRQESADIHSIASTLTPECELSPAVINRISAEAEQRHSSRRVIFMQPAVQMLAYAAVFVLMLGGWMFMNSASTDTKLNEISAIMMVAYDHELDIAGEGFYSKDDTDIEMLANELMILQGWATEEEITGFEYLEQEPDSKALQSHNNPGALQRICV